MSTQNSSVGAITSLKEIFKNHQNDRICVIGTTCCGKTTLLRQIPGCVDMDEALGPLLTPEESAYICQTPWTKQIGEFYDKLIYEKIKIYPGSPMFGTVIVDCDVVIYLDIGDALLKEHCQKRNVPFDSAKEMKIAVERDVDNHRNRGDIKFYFLTLVE